MSLLDLPIIEVLVGPPFATQPTPGNPWVNLIVELIAPAQNPTSGITQVQADARYIKLTQINTPNGVGGLDALAALDGGNF